jgi:hypothetical protein
METLLQEVMAVEPQVVVVVPVVQELDIQEAVLLILLHKHRMVAQVLSHVLLVLLKLTAAVVVVLMAVPKRQARQITGVVVAVLEMVAVETDRHIAKQMALC